MSSRPPFEEGRFVGQSIRPPDDLEELEVVWFVVCDCVTTGEADEPAPGPVAGSCDRCGEVVRAEWSPTIHNPKENPTMHLHTLRPRPRGPELVSAPTREPAELLAFDEILRELDEHAEEAERLRTARGEIVRTALEAGHTPAELAGRAGLSAERIRQWHREAVR